jgi:exopolysaccharide biosynthesis protein
MAFDGGGSTEMVLHKRIVNHPSDGNQRLVPSGLFVYRKPTKKH